MHGELAGVAAGVGAELALVGPLVRVDAQVLLEAAAVHGRVVAEVALVRLHAGVAAHMHGQVVLPAEALVTELALVRLVSCKHTSKSHGFGVFVHQDAGREIQPRRWAESRALPFPSDQRPETGRHGGLDKRRGTRRCAVSFVAQNFCRLPRSRDKIRLKGSHRPTLFGKMRAFLEAVKIGGGRWRVSGMAFRLPS